MSYIFHKHGALVASPIAMLERRDEAARIDIEQLFWFLVWVYFDVFIRNGVMLERYPNSLDKRAWGFSCKLWK